MVAPTGGAGGAAGSTATPSASSSGGAGGKGTSSQPDVGQAAKGSNNKDDRAERLAKELKKGARRLWNTTARSAGYEGLSVDVNPEGENSEKDTSDAKDGSAEEIAEKNRKAGLGGVGSFGDEEGNMG